MLSVARPFKTESKTGKKYLIWEKEKVEHCERDIEKRKRKNSVDIQRYRTVGKAETKVKVGTLKVTKVK
jgi:hypothetical protein